MIWEIAFFRPRRREGLRRWSGSIPADFDSNLAPHVPVNKMAGRNTRCSFHSSLLVLGRVEGVALRRSSPWGTTEGFVALNYIQLESSVNSANLRKNIAQISQYAHAS